jgi:hypothetical protein
LQNFVDAIGQHPSRKKSDSYTGARDAAGQPHGLGKMLDADGSVYEGQFIHGVKNGTGKIWDSNGKLTGDGIWENDQIIEGFGSIKYSDGCLYCGELKSGLRNGKGVNLWPDGATYDGNWINNERNGFGDQLYAEGTKYIGEFKNGCRHGKGIYTWLDGDQYEGEWEDGAKHGIGIFTCADGTRYEGEWKNNEKNGKGVQTWPDGANFHGDWENGYINGFGTFISADCSRYDGEFKNSKKHGTGILIYPNGDKYEGGFCDDYREGIGTLIEKNGNRYEGEWKGDFQNGSGTYYTGEWKTAKGLFVNGHFRKGEILYRGNGDVILKGEFDAKELLVNGIINQNAIDWGRETTINNYCCINGKCWDENGIFEGSFMYSSIKECGHNEPTAIPNNGISNGFDGRYGKILNGKLEGAGIKTGQYLKSFKEYGYVTRIEGYFVHDEPKGDCHLTFENGLTASGEGDGNGNLSMFIP